MLKFQVGQVVFGVFNNWRVPVIYQVRIIEFKYSVGGPWYRVKKLGVADRCDMYWTSNGDNLFVKFEDAEKAFNEAVLEYEANEEKKRLARIDEEIKYLLKDQRAKESFERFKSIYLDE